MQASDSPGALPYTPGVYLSEDDHRCHILVAPRPCKQKPATKHEDDDV
jgi:hypothetical protein